MVNWHMYNTTGFTANGTSGYQSMVTFVQQTSQATSSLPGTAILIATWLVLFFALRTKGNPVKVCVAASSWVITILALMMYPLGIINSAIYIVSLVITPISVLLLFLMEND